MTLLELKPRFLSFHDDERLVYGSTDIGAIPDGLMFKCPLCYERNERRIEGVHSVVCWQPHVPLLPHLTGPGRWSITGDGYKDLSLVAGSSSVKLMGGCNAHFHITNGKVTPCSDMPQWL